MDSIVRYFLKHWRIFAFSRELVCDVFLTFLNFIANDLGCNNILSPAEIHTYDFSTKIKKLLMKSLHRSGPNFLSSVSPE